MGAKKRKVRMGRPPKPPGEKWAARISVNMTRAEHKKVSAEAKRLGISLSALLMLPWRESEE